MMKLSIIMKIIMNMKICINHKKVCLIVHTLQRDCTEVFWFR